MPLYMYRVIFGGRRLKPTTGLISHYVDSPVAYLGSCTTILLTGHRVSDTKENYIPSQRHKRVPDSGQRDSTVRVYTFSKVYPTGVGTTAEEACTPKNIKMKTM